MLQVLMVGGTEDRALATTPASSASQLLDFALQPLAWQQEQMAVARVMPDAVLLPDGTVVSPCMLDMVRPCQGSCVAQKGLSVHGSLSHSSTEPCDHRRLSIHATRKLQLAHRACSCTGPVASMAVQAEPQPPALTVVPSRPPASHAAAACS